MIANTEVKISNTQENKNENKTLRFIFLCNVFKILILADYF